MVGRVGALKGILQHSLRIRHQGKYRVDLLTEDIASTASGPRSASGETPCQCLVVVLGRGDDGGTAWILRFAYIVR